MYYSIVRLVALVAKAAGVTIIIINNNIKRALGGIWTPDLYLIEADIPIIIINRNDGLTKVTLYQAELPRQLNEQSNQRTL
jgi:hypothetical protein